MSDNDNDNEKPPVVLDEHRGMAAQKATDARRHQSEVVHDQATLRHNRALLEDALFAAPAANWAEATARCTYLLDIFADTAEAQDPRLKQLIREVIDDFRRLGAAETPAF